MNPKTYKTKSGQTTVMLGSLGLQIKFSLPEQKETYITLTYPPSNVNHGQGCRPCMNAQTSKVHNFACREKVVIVQ